MRSYKPYYEHGDRSMWHKMPKRKRLQKQRQNTTYLPESTKTVPTTVASASNLCRKPTSWQSWNIMKSSFDWINMGKSQKGWFLGLTQKRWQNINTGQRCITFLPRLSIKFNHFMRLEEASSRESQKWLAILRNLGKDTQVWACWVLATRIPGYKRQETHRTPIFKSSGRANFLLL